MRRAAPAWQILRARSRSGRKWPRVVPRAAVSYVLCVAEIAEQLTERRLDADALYVSSSGATGAGVALGRTLLGWTCPTRLICPMHWPWHIPTRICDDANAAAERMGLPHRITVSDVDADESYIAPGYGLPSPAGQEAIGEALVLARGCFIPGAVKRITE